MVLLLSYLKMSPSVKDFESRDHGGALKKRSRLIRENEAG